MIVLYTVIVMIGTMVILSIAEQEQGSKFHATNRVMKYLVIPLVLGMMLTVAFVSGYRHGVESMVPAAPAPERPVVAEAGPQYVSTARLDPELQAMLKDVTGQPQASEQDVQAAGVIRNHWNRLAECESNGEWHYNPNTATWGNGLFEGGLQFHPDTWDAFKPDGYPDAAYNATREQQVEVGRIVRDAQGWKAWPKCSKEIGLR